MSESLLTVALYAGITAVATGLGAVPFLFFRRVTRRWLGYSNAVAAGLMLTASFTLIYEGIAYSLWRTMAGVLAGLVFIMFSNEWLEGRDDLSISHLEGADARRAILIVAVMTLHSFTEGVGVGVSFGGDEGLGLFITAAIAIHNIPEGLAIALVMVPRGVRWWVAGLYAVLSSAPQPLMAVPSYMFVEAVEPFLPVGLGFAGGAMIWMVFSEIIPEANEESVAKHIGAIVTISIAAMFVVQEFLR